MLTASETELKALKIRARNPFGKNKQSCDRNRTDSPLSEEITSEYLWDL